MRLDYFAKTDTGKVRKENQDSYGIVKSKDIYIVCDGMGGGAAGDFASRCAVEIMLYALEMLKQPEVDSVIGKSVQMLYPKLLWPVAAIRLANRGLHNFTTRYPKLAGMGTTVVATLFDDHTNTLHMYHVGDSRVYRLRNGILEQLTKDHSKINELVDSGKMTQDEVKTAEIQSMITRALGINPTVKVDYRAEHLKTGDVLLLCSDGLNTELEDAIIKDILVTYKGDTEQIAKHLIEAANEAGGRDNTTVVVLAAEDDNRKEDLPFDTRPGNVLLVPDETPEQSAVEDRLLKEIISGTHIDVPALAKEKNLFTNPIFLGIAITALVVSTLFILPRLSERKPDTTLVNLAGKVTGLTIDVREPTPDQLQAFRNSDDAVQKLQMIQDWYSNIEKYTVPLKNVELIIESEGKEKFRTLTDVKPVPVKLDKGMLTVRAKYPNYSIITPTMELRDSASFNVEYASDYKPVTFIMVPR